MLLVGDILMLLEVVAVWAVWVVWVVWAVWEVWAVLVVNRQLLSRNSEGINQKNVVGVPSPCAPQCSGN